MRKTKKNMKNIKDTKRIETNNSSSIQFSNERVTKIKKQRKKVNNPRDIFPWPYDPRACT